MRPFMSVALLLACISSPAQEAAQTRKWTVDTDQREAVIYAPPGAKSEKASLVFVFHGHGGTAANAAKAFHLQTLWPEAIVVYPQGLKTPGLLTDPEGKRTGWQSVAGSQKDRDLHFFDQMLADLKKDYKVDENRIYCTGHSNGGSFTYLLWAERGPVFAAVAPSAAPGFKQLPTLKPKPVLHVAGEKDALVKFEWQQMTMQRLRKINATTSEGKDWPDGKYSKIYTSENGPPVVTQIHPAGHNFNRDAPDAIVAFFKKYSKQPAVK